MKYAGQLIAYAAFFVLVAVLSVRPELRLLGDQQAIVSLSFSHAAQRIGECQRLSQEELMALPPNMRKPDRCPRERHLLQVRLTMDGQTLYEAALAPTGLWSDGKATAYQRLEVSAGTHEFGVRMNDSGVPGQVDFENTATINVQPGQNLVVFFDPASRQFRFK
jgi:hypothetical protein